jgi:hypothetical protein
LAVQKRGDQAQTVFRIAAIPLGIPGVWWCEMMDRNAVAGDGVPAGHAKAFRRKRQLIGFVGKWSGDDRHSNSAENA